MDHATIMFLAPIFIMFVITIVIGILFVAINELIEYLRERSAKTLTTVGIVAVISLVILFAFIARLQWRV